MRNINEELDYRIEAQSQIEFANKIKSLPQIIVPEVIEELSCETILVSHWEEGQSLDTVRQNMGHKSLFTISVHFFVVTKSLDLA
jgi:predicted unusual protein kinase regulating ubiquinone biosynthesis (AarF/ABC1/UbiB family)